VETDPRRADVTPGTFLPLWRQLPPPTPVHGGYEIPSAELALHFYRRAHASMPWWRRMIAAVRWWW
jgi:hypothetical protein